MIAGILLIALPLTLNARKSSPAADSSRVTRTSDNVRLGANKQTLRGVEAPGLAVDPGDSNHLVEVQVDMLAGECQYNVTSDAGSHWKGSVLRPPSGYQPSGQVPCSVTAGTPMDSSVAFGSGSNVYTTFADQAMGGPKNHAALVARSTDGGASFGTAKVAMPEGSAPKTASGSPGPDYGAPKLAVIKGGGSSGADRILLIAQNSGCVAAPCVGTLAFASSNDSGSTWSRPVTVNAAFDPTSNPYGVTETAPIVADSTGTYSVGWRTRAKGFASPDPGLAKGFIRIARSTDKGATWKETDATPVRGYTYSGPATPPFTKVPISYCCSSFPRLAIDATSSELYLTWNQGPGLYSNATTYQAQDHFINPQTDVWFMRSADGVQWTDRQQVNESPIDGEPTQTRHPNVSVGPNGRVDLVWQDRRLWYHGCTATHVACPEARLGDTYYSYSTDGGKSFSHNRRITDRSLNNDVGFDYRYGTYWDYGPVSVPLANGQVFVAWMDSREGSHDNDNQDIYTAKTPVTTSGALPVKLLAADTAADLSVQLSKWADPGGSEATLVSTFATGPASRVVIVNDKDVAGALSGGVLARAFMGPLLLSPSSGLPASVKAEVKRMGAVGAYVIGDSTQLSSQVESDLAAAGVPASQITRVSAASPAEIAAKIAVQLDRRTATNKAAQLPAFRAAILVNPDSAEAVTASTLAVNRRLPILYVSKDSIPQATSDALTALNINATLIVGGDHAVGNQVLSQLAGAGRNPNRLAGTDAVAVSRSVVQQSLTLGQPVNNVFVVRAENRMQGALIGAASGRVGGILVATHNGSTTDAQNMLGGLGVAAQVDRLIETSASAW
ncbi:MAG: hypothetical protein NVSMB29_02390 [Candidatus Dormibacteria bacterium]